MTALVARGLCKSFGAIRAVDNVGLTVAAGSMVAIIGPNGAGKSTCFNLLTGQLRPESGSIQFDGKEITDMAPRHIWRLGIGRTFQIAATFLSMTVLENVQVALLSHHRRLFAIWPRVEALYAQEALALLDLTGMAEQADKPCSALAYGDLKRVELAMALAHAPRLLLMDEPTAGMATAERAALMAMTAQIVARRGIAVLFTEHDMDIVFTHAQRVLVLNRGTVVAEGTAEAVRADPRVRDIYLGEETAKAGRP